VSLPSFTLLPRSALAVPSKKLHQTTHKYIVRRAETSTACIDTLSFDRIVFRLVGQLAVECELRKTGNGRTRIQAT